MWQIPSGYKLPFHNISHLLPGRTNAGAAPVLESVVLFSSTDFTTAIKLLNKACRQDSMSKELCVGTKV